MKTSESVKEIFSALSKAQGEFSVASKDAKNPFFKSKYADYESVVNACRSQLAKNGLGFIQMFEDIDTHKSITTRIIHASGEWIESSMSFKLIKDDPQTFGSASTYYKRYALQSALGIVASDEDDDAEAAQCRDKPQAQQVKPLTNHAPQTQAEAMAPSKFATRDTVASLYAIGRAKKYADDEIKKVILNTSGAKSMTEIPPMAVGVIKAYLESNEPGGLK